MKSVEVNGVRLHYLQEGSGRPVVLVHGNGESHALFETEIKQLTAAGYEVFAPDSRGHGANEPVSEYHYADMADDIFCLIRELGLEKPYYFGHSDGGIIGLLLELRHPGTLGKMAVSGTNLSPDGIVPEFVEEFTAINEREPNPLITLMLTVPHIDPAELRKITIPVLVTVGEHDLILPEETQRIVQNLPDVKLIVVPGADHGSYLDHDERMGEFLLDFYAEQN
ncbi:MAG: alpha/beta hydrolase [Lachnospiraceae bacterium]|nr:alpha/beta hydrolase [Lachnospiraceae bacterium]